MVRTTGGNTKNPLLMAIKAAVYDRAIGAAETAKATALGAALLGGCAAGVFPDLASAVAGTSPGRTGSRSRRALSARLSAGLRRLRPLHHAAAALESAAGLTARPPG